MDGLSWGQVSKTEIVDRNVPIYLYYTSTTRQISVLVFEKYTENINDHDRKKTYINS